MDFLTPTLDFELKKPLYSQLYEYIRHEITQGSIPPGERLPSKRKLSAHLNISQNTVQAAYDQLLVEGYVGTQPKRGVYVNELDNLINLEIDLEKPHTRPQRQQPSRNFRYDFGPGSVDSCSFPVRTWKRLVCEVLGEGAADLAANGYPQGDPALRSTISAYLHQSRGVVCDPGQIIVGSGIENLLQLLIQLLGKNLVFALENPGYEKINLLFESNKKRFVPIDLDDEGVSITALSQSEADILYVTPSHQFPTGLVMPIRRRLSLLKWAHAAPERYIIEDDYDGEFKYRGKPIPAMQGLDGGQKTIYIGSFSNSLAPSLRISYMVLPSHLLDRYLDRLSFYVCPVPAIEQQCLRLFIGRGHFARHLNRMRTVYKRKRELLAGAIERTLKDVEILGENAGLHLMLRVKNGMREDELVETAARCGVRLVGASRYYLRYPANRPFPDILLSYGALPEEDIANAISSLGKAWS